MESVLTSARIAALGELLLDDDEGLFSKLVTSLSPEYLDEERWTKTHEDWLVDLIHEL